MNKLYLLSILIFTGTGVLSAQQLSNRTGLNSMDFQFNPALTAVDLRTTLFAETNHQWMGFEDNPVTHRVAGQAPLAKGRIGVGAFIESSTAVGLNRTSVGASYAYHFSPGAIGNDLLSLGLSVSADNWRSNLDNVRVADANDPAAMRLWTGKPQLGLGGGFRYQTNKDLGQRFEKGVFLGAAATQFLFSEVRRDISNEVLFRRVMHSNAHLGFRINDGQLDTEVSVWVENSDFAQWLLTGRVRFTLRDVVWGGVSYGFSNAVVYPYFGVAVWPDMVGRGDLYVGSQFGFSVGSTVAKPGSDLNIFVGYAADF